MAKGTVAKGSVRVRAAWPNDAAHILILGKRDGKFGGRVSGATPKTTRQRRVLPETSHGDGGEGTAQHQRKTVPQARNDLKNQSSSISNSNCSSSIPLRAKLLNLTIEKDFADFLRFSTQMQGRRFEKWKQAFLSDSS